MEKIYVSILTLLILITISLGDVSLAAKNSKTTKNNITAEELAIQSNKSLSSLSLKEYELSPTFNKNNLNYYVIIPQNVSKIDVEAKAEEAGAIVKVTGNTSLTKQENVINIRVTAIDGTSRLYTITVVKQPEVNLKLESLQVEGVNINPVFDDDIFYYTASLEDTELTNLNITATPADESASIEIMGGNNLVDGENLINIILTKGKEKTIYQLNVNVDFLGEKEKEVTNVIAQVRQIVNYVIIGLIAFAIFIVLIIIIAIIKKSKKKNKGGKRHD